MSGPSYRYRRGQVSYSPAELADASLIDAFKMRARNWWNKVIALKTMQVPASLESERQKLLSYAQTVKSAIQKVTSLHDSLKIDGLSGMGALPLVPIAIIGAATGAIAYWLNDYAAFMKQVEYQRNLVSQGVDPIKAAQIAADTHEQTQGQTGPLGFLFKNWQLIALGVGGLFLFKMLRK